MLRRSRRRDWGHLPLEGESSTPKICAHLAADVVEPEPLTPGQCQGCTDLGENTWAHLRKCTTCGYVACCDSSPHQHATGHFRETGHAVMRSAEPGESWRWCYIDLRLG